MLMIFFCVIPAHLLTFSSNDAIHFFSDAFHGRDIKFHCTNLFVRTSMCIHPIKSRAVRTSFHYPAHQTDYYQNQKLSKWGCTLLFVRGALLKLAQLNVVAHHLHSR